MSQPIRLSQIYYDAASGQKSKDQTLKQLQQSLYAIAPSNNMQAINDVKGAIREYQVKGTNHGTALASLQKLTKY